MRDLCLILSLNQLLSSPFKADCKNRFSRVYIVIDTIFSSLFNVHF